jgi:hypothetical protein
VTVFNILLIIGHNHTTNSPCPLPLDRALDALCKPNKIIENIIIFLTYASGETNKNKLAELKPVLQLVKVSSDKEEEEEYAGGQIAKKGVYET